MFLVENAPTKTQVTALSDDMYAALEKIQDKDESAFVCFSNTKSVSIKDNKKFGPIGLVAYPIKEVLADPNSFEKDFKYIHVIQPLSKKILHTEKIEHEAQRLKVLQKMFGKELTLDLFHTRIEALKRKGLGPFGKGVSAHQRRTFMMFIRYDENLKLRTAQEINDLFHKAGIDIIEDEGFCSVVHNADYSVVFMRTGTFKIAETVSVKGVPKGVPNVPEDEDEETKQMMQRYSIPLEANTPLRQLKSWEEVEEKLPEMDSDDLAWHLTHGKFSGQLEGNPHVRSHIGFREICFMQLQNLNLPKTRRDQIASYMLDKAGVSFVGGASLKAFIMTLSKRGVLGKSFLRAAEEDSIEDDIFYGKITDPDALRKFDVKEYYHQLSHNPYTPVDVLEKIVKLQGELEWSGLNPKSGGIVGDTTTIRFKNAITHPNYPIKGMVDAYKNARKLYPRPGSIPYLAQTLLKKPDCPAELKDELRKEFASKKKSTYDEPEMDKILDTTRPFEDRWKDALKYHTKLTKAKDFNSKYCTSVEYKFSDLLQDPDVTDECLDDILNWKVRDDDKGNPIEWLVDAKRDAFKLLRSKNRITETDAAEAVRKNLKFEGPDSLLALFGQQAYLGGSANKLKFKKISDAELKALSAKMASQASHNDFTFEVVDAYRFDKPLHKDYQETAKKIGNVSPGLWHGTSCSNAAGILCSGVNVNAEARTGSMFGAGFYLASVSSKAVQYASDNFSKDGLGIVFQLNAALGNSKEMKYGRPRHDELESGYDIPEEILKKAKTYKAKNKLKSLSTAWHMDHDSVSARAGMALLHDEYVVKNGNQIEIELVIIVKKQTKEGA